MSDAQNMTLGFRARALLLCATLLLCGILPVAAHADAPAWRFTLTSQPTNFVPGAVNANHGAFTFLPQYALIAHNIGSASTSSVISVSDTLPSGITPVNASSTNGSAQGNVLGGGTCNIASQTVTCPVAGPVRAGEWLIVNIGVNVDPLLAEGSTVANRATISGGGAATVDAATDTTISSSDAAFGLLPGDNGLSGTFTDADGLPVTQAGAHPYQLTVDLTPSTALDGYFITGTGGGVRDLGAVLPRGVVVNPDASPVRCTEAQLENQNGGVVSCPAASQVGVVDIVAPALGLIPNVTPLYNMVPPAGTPAELAFDAVGVGIYAHIKGGVRAGDYALTATSTDILARTGNPLLGVQVQLWGDPSDPRHIHSGLGDVVPRTTPFLTMPTACSDSLAFAASTDSWLDPGNFVTATGRAIDANGDSTGVSGCSQLDFQPSIAVKPDISVADSPSGLHVDLKIPQTDSLLTLATANLKDAVVTLPAGVSLSPSAADGLSACSSAQIDLARNTEPGCPDSSKIGTVRVDTPLLPDPLQGSVFVAAQNDNPSHSVLGIYVTAEGSGVVIKLAGHVQADPATGQLTATFADNPQLPFSDFQLDFRGGSRAVLATPDGCGTYTTKSGLSPWSGTPTVSLDDSFSIGSGCDGGFSPAFTAGVVRPRAGASSTFTLQVSRPDGQQHLRSVSTTLAPGILADIGSVSLCAESDAVAGTCDAASQVGSTDTSAGPGSDPFHIAGKVYLTGPYKGAPYGLSIVVPAIAGPFNLGTVVVRAAINVDPTDAHVTVVSDDIPNLLDVTGDDGHTDGFPLRVRSLAVNMDRPGFMLNPTSCDPMSITGTLGSWEGATVPVASHFQVGNCSTLALSPKIGIALTGKGQTTDDKHPGVNATLTQAAGQSNLKKVVVSLPLSLALDPDNANGLCEFADGSKVDPTCPKASIVGKAVARTPILDQPLSGPVYFVKNIRKDAKTGREIRTLPKLVIPLTGENGLRLNLVGTSNVVNNRLVTTFDNIPDAPVSDFTLDIIGGKGGILVVSGTDICKATQVADQQIDGQNGKTADTSVYLQTPACALKILSKKVGKSTVAVKVGGLSAGKVTVTGHGIKKTTKTITKSTVATITAKRTHGKPGKVTVSFDPTGPAKAHKTTK